MREDVTDMILLIKEKSGTAEEEKRGLEALYTLTSFNMVVFIRLRAGDQ